jgi:methylated-DNA-[protein]-cysteine S-methyltransferase
MEVEIFDSALGWMAVVGEEGVLSRVLFGYESELAVWRALDLAGVPCGRAVRWHPRLAGQLQDAACGEPQRLDSIELDLSSYTAFACDVLTACRGIPWGRTRTYGELAAACGAAGAARAVGNVMASNRFPLVVPCHRVVAAGGRLGGFSAPQGLAMKRRLLALERGTAWRPRRVRRAANVIA